MFFTQQLRHDSSNSMAHVMSSRPLNLITENSIKYLNFIYQRERDIYIYISYQTIKPSWIFPQQYVHLCFCLKSLSSYFPAPIHHLSTIFSSKILSYSTHVDFGDVNDSVIAIPFSSFPEMSSMSSPKF